MILTEMQRHSLLGVNGAKEVQKGASWKQYARGYSDEVMQCRITNGIMQAGRPENEQDELKQFVFIGDKKTAAEKLASVTPTTMKAGNGKSTASAASSRKNCSTAVTM